MKIGVYGGTFNPIHSGHLHILQEFSRRLGLERVLLIPAGTPPHKDAPALAGGKDRLNMCALAAKELEGVSVELSAIELNRAGKSYTAETLELLRGRFPKDEFYLLMGEDMFLTVDKWYRPETIFSLAALCASPRSEDGLARLKEKKAELERKFAAKCFIENIRYLPVSSTQVRELAAKGKSLQGLVPDGVERYIRERGLYAPGKEQEG